MYPSYSEEILVLRRLLKHSTFRLVTVRYDSEDIVNRLEKDIKYHCNDRIFVSLDAEKITLEDILGTCKELSRSVIFLKNFERILHDESWTDLTALTRFKSIRDGLNVSVDIFVEQRNALFIFVRASSDGRFIRSLIREMPDLWSLRTLELNLQEMLSINEEGNGLYFSNSTEISTFSKAKTFLTNGRIDLCFNLLRGNRHLENDLVSLSARYTMLERDFDKGRIQYKEYSIHINNVIASLNNLISNTLDR
ncbi:MAG: hypothetical protein AAF849_09750 [Bacteroidota bacterium]